MRQIVIPSQRNARNTTHEMLRRRRRDAVTHNYSTSRIHESSLVKFKATNDNKSLTSKSLIGKSLTSTSLVRKSLTIKGTHAFID